MSKPRSKLFSQSDAFDETEINSELELDTWPMTIYKGLIQAIIVIVINILFVLFMNLIGFGGFLLLVRGMMIFEGILFLFRSALVIYFGPSPMLANLSANIFRRSPKYTSTSVALRNGTRLMVIGLLLLFLPMIV